MSLLLIKERLLFVGEFALIINVWHQLFSSSECNVFSYNIQIRVLGSPTIFAGLFLKIDIFCFFAGTDYVYDFKTLVFLARQKFF